MGEAYGTTETIQLLLGILYATFAALYVYAVYVNDIALMEAYAYLYMIYIPLMLLVDLSVGFMFVRYGDFIGELLFKNSAFGRESYPLIIIATYALRLYFYLVITSLLEEAQMECDWMFFLWNVFEFLIKL